MSSQDDEQDEREQIQDDIERLELVLQEGDDYEDIDDENALHIDQDYVPDYDDGADIKPGSSGIITFHEEDQDYEDGSGDGEETDDIQLGTADLAQLQMMGEDGEIVINPETCLALNRAYQEILLDLLRKIEISLQENRSKQTTLEEELSMKASRKYISSSEPHSVIKPLTWFRVPFFKDINGRHAPQNEDVRLKKSLGELKQDHLFPVVWLRGQREILKEAVERDAQEKLIRPLMNKKEVEAEKLLLADKNKKSKVKKEIESTLKDIDKEIEDIRSNSFEKLLSKVGADDIDWMKISNIDFSGKHGSEDCKKFWVNVLQPEINKDKWVPEERDLLHELAIKHEMRNWDLIAKELGTNRSAYQCLQYYQQNLNVNFSSRQWTEEEDDLLKEVVENCRVGYRISWNQVCYFIEGRNWKQCQRRWVQIDPATKRGRWSAEEDLMLLSAVHLHGTTNWRLIHEMVPGRSAYQCRDRYTNCLDPNLKPPTTWTYEEDKKLLQLASKYTSEDGSAISWTKVAAEMEGRTDNMILSRYKRLKSWKIRADWLNTQNDETKAYLGTIFNKDEQESQPPVSDLKVPMGTFATGVQREDYLKQIRDKQAGDIVVPRPPLSHRFKTRNMEQLWQRKLQLKKLVEHHLQKTLSKTVTSQDKMLIPSKTAQEFVPFVKLNKKQQIEMNDLFKDKDPCTVKVSDMLAITNKYKDHGNAATEKRLRRFTKDQRIDRKMADIVQMKNYMSMITRSGAGRPKKFYIFYPYGKSANKEVTENIAQLTSISTTLMLSALEVNGHKALQNAQRKPENQMSESEKDNLAILKKLFPPLPACMRAQPVSNSQLKTVQDQKTVTLGKTPAVPATEGKSAPKASTLSVDKLQGLTVSVTNKSSHLSGHVSVSKSEKTVTIVKPTNVQGAVTQSSIHTATAVTSSKTLRGNIPISSSQPTVRRKQVDSVFQKLSKQTVRNKPQSSVDPQTRSSSTSIPVSTVSASVSNIQATTAQPPRVVVVQKQGTPTPSNIPLLPPGVKNLEAFAGLVVQFQLLTASAGSMYNEKYYKNVSRQIRSSLISSQSKKESQDESLVKTVLNSFKNRSSAAVMRGAKHVNKDPFTKNSESSSLRDTLSDVRTTPEYKLLQKRFEGLFTWPALLSTVKVGGNTQKEEEVSSLLSGKKARMAKRRKMLESKPAEPEPDVDMGDLLAAGEKSFAAKVKKALVRKEYKRKRYPCSNGKHFYRNQLLNKEHRQRIIRRRMVVRRLNKELREQGISVNDLSSKEKPLKKRLHPTRQSTRIAKKKNADMSESQPTTDIQTKGRKRKLGKNVEGKKEKVDQTKTDESLLDQRLMTDTTHTELGDVQNKGQISASGLSSYCNSGHEHMEDHSHNSTESGVQKHYSHSIVSTEEKLVKSRLCTGENDSDVTFEDESYLALDDVIPLELNQSSKHSSRTSVSPSQHSLGPSVAKKMRTEITGNSESSVTSGNSVDHDASVEVMPPLHSVTILHGPQTSITAGTVKCSSSIPKGTGLQSSNTMGPITVFPGMGSPSSQRTDPVHIQSNPVVTGEVPVIGGPIAAGSSIPKGSPSNVTVPFKHPGLEGHVLFAIPVEQLAQSSSQLATGLPHQEGVFPVTLLINSNTLSFSPLVSCSENQPLPTDQHSVIGGADNEPVNQTAESVTSGETIGSVAANQTAENLATNQTKEKDIQSDK